MRASDRWIVEAEKALGGGALSSAVIASYLTMFHSARAVLFRDGYREKSHACVARYLEETYVRTGKLESRWVSLLDHARELRHEGQYDTVFMATKQEAEKAISTAKEFTERMKALAAEH